MTQFPAVSAQADVIASNFDHSFNAVVAQASVDATDSSVTVAIKGKLGRRGPMGQQELALDSFQIAKGADGKLTLSETRVLDGYALPSTTTTTQLPYTAENVERMLLGMKLVGAMSYDVVADKLGVLAAAIRATLPQTPKNVSSALAWADWR
jgi:hypothetical protein